MVKIEVGKKIDLAQDVEVSKKKKDPDGFKFKDVIKQLNPDNHINNKSRGVNFE